MTDQATTVTRQTKLRPAAPVASNRTDHTSNTSRGNQRTATPRLVTVRALISHNSMLAGETATVPYTERLQNLIARGYLDPAVEADPLTWMDIM